MSQQPDDFYVGYLPDTPPSTRRLVRRTVFILGFSMILAGAIIFSGQQPFANSVFEFGVSTEVSGILHLSPVPHLEVLPAEELSDLGSRSILLVGFGKFGAKGTLLQASKQQGRPIDGQQVQLRGTLLYRDGKTLLELSENEKSILSILPPEFPSQEQPTSLGYSSLAGEILDAKCYFGVMKPGSGKPHRSCAVRCISGGIPPVMQTQSFQNGDNHIEYVLLVGPNGEMINDRVLDYVAQPMQVCGEIRQIGDWKVCRVNLDEGFTPLAPYSSLRDLVSCQPSRE